VQPERSLSLDLGGSDLVLDGGLDWVCPLVATRRTSRVTRVESMEFGIRGNFREFLIVIAAAAEEVRRRKT
jgi:hypothetical protein